jgi:oligogalacturonide transporter
MTSTIESAAPVTSTPESEKLSRWQKIGYGLGDIYGGGSGVLVSFYYLYFLTDVVRLNPALAGTVILISKVYDAITDPFEGVLGDRTRTRLGRRRPYLLAGIPLIFISFFLLFYPVSLDSQAGRFAFVLLSYLFFSTVVSIVMLNYNALQSELTLDYDERTSLSSTRILFSTVASIVAAVLPLEIVALFSDVRSGYIAMAAFFGAFFALPFIATVAATRERPDFQRPPRPFHWRQAFVEPFQVRSFVILLAMYLFAFVAIDAVSSIVIYFMTYYLGRGDEASFVSGTLLVAQVISLPFYVWISKRWNKRTGYMVGAVAWMVVMLTSLLITPGQPAYFVYVFAVLVGLSTGGIVIMVYAMFPDIPDVDELKSGERREGIYAAMFTFMRKLSSAVAIFLISTAIAWAGYLPPVETVVDGAVQLVEQAQPQRFILTLRLVFALLPVVLLSIALVVARRYPLTHAVHQRLNAVLARQRESQTDSAEIQPEAQALSELLIGGK